MPDQRASVRRCPDCGGILQSTEPEALTSADVARTGDERPEPPARRQCLICGYEDAAQPAHASPVA